MKTLIPIRKLYTMGNANRAVITATALKGADLSKLNQKVTLFCSLTRAISVNIRRRGDLLYITVYISTPGDPTNPRSVSTQMALDNACRLAQREIWPKKNINDNRNPSSPIINIRHDLPGDQVIYKTLDDCKLIFEVAMEIIRNTSKNIDVRELLVIS